MHVKHLIVILFVLLIAACSSASTPTPSPRGRTPRPTRTEAAQAEPTATVKPTRARPTVEQTSVPEATVPPAPTVTPTTPPPLPLRDDLPPVALKDWPRPADDNGLGIHFLATGYYDATELDRQIARMQALHVKWALVLYADENHLQLAAEKFKAAGMMVVWRKTLRPFQRYASWGRDIDILKKVGMPPYMQLYNEPELDFEWEGNEQNWDQYWGNLFQAAKDVYNSGGYPGIQLLDEDNLRTFIDQVYARKGEALFHRMFFIPHSYGLNHPPDYVQDTNGVLGWSIYAQIFQRRLGFIPPFIVGEGGWKVGSTEDNRYPAVTEELHRDYTLSVVNWFKTGTMSNGKPLPDYLFAFCHWMLAGAQEAGAWYDAFNGNRTLTINAISQMPAFTRKFSWGK